jgi:hypothetical protein
MGDIPSPLCGGICLWVRLCPFFTECCFVCSLCWVQASASAPYTNCGLSEGGGGPDMMHPWTGGSGGNVGVGEREVAGVGNGFVWLLQLHSICRQGDSLGTCCAWGWDWRLSSEGSAQLGLLVWGHQHVWSDIVGIAWPHQPECPVVLCSCVCVPGVRVLCSCVPGVWATHLACGPRNCWCLKTVQGAVCIIATPSDVLPHPWFNHSTCQALTFAGHPPNTAVHALLCSKGYHVL